MSPWIILLVVATSIASAVETVISFLVVRQSKLDHRDVEKEIRALDKRIALMYVTSSHSDKERSL